MSEEVEIKQETNVESPQPSGSSTCKPSVSKKKGCTSNNKLNYYIRQKVMDNIVENGCDSRDCATLIRKLKLDPDIVEQFVNEKAQAAQANVHEECDSICFKNINSWLSYFKEKNYNSEANLESGMLMIAIANMEHHPDPKENGGVDFKKIYRFLGDVMLGNPTPELNRESIEFLGREFENLIGEANTTKGDEDARVLQLNIECESKQINTRMSTAAKKNRREYGSLDPMGIDNFISGPAK